MLSRSTIVSIIPAVAVAAAGIAATAPAQAATTTITAATAGTKAVGATTYMWGTTDAPAGSSICSQVSLNANWSTSQCSTVQADHSYTVELTYGKNNAGTYTFRAVTGGIASSSVTLTRASSTGTPGPTSSTLARYTTGTANVRSGPSTSNVIVTNLGLNTRVTGTISGTWLKIATPINMAGRYISTTVLTATAPAAPTGGTPTSTTGMVYDNGVLGNGYTLYSGYNGVKAYLAQKALGMATGPMGSSMGKNTMTALSAFQKNWNASHPGSTSLRTDGVLDEATWNQLPIEKDDHGVRYPFTIDSWAMTSDLMDNARRDVKVNAMLNFAKAQLGKPYIWGGTGPMGFDCSGLLLQAARAGGMKPSVVSNFTDVRTASDLSNQMMRDDEFQKGSLDLNKLQAGDFIYYGGRDGVAHHVSMYVGKINGVESVINAVDDVNAAGQAVSGSTRYSPLSSNISWPGKLAVNRAVAL